ncbi:B3 domain-containing protein REM16-like [Amaranthus tricolor]|uniref:B3 domain-containing protein REM16-like n=1 Tax=Amaranthus tricolor TaxID=29722 RepID=UPI00258C21AE|nr:B3 domain-containing protein REM16-like [Amaranthus tricolor]
MEDKCEECESWAQKMYWKHFKCLHFCQILEGHDFHSQLVIPRKFSDNVKAKLQETVTLKAPNGTASWQVKLMPSDDALILKDGWSEFLNAFSVQMNDIMIFKYTGESCFHVQIFDRRNLCEKESSYFIRKCDHSESDRLHQDMKFVEQSPEEVMQEDFASTPPNKRTGDTISQPKVYSVDDTGTANEKARLRKPACTWEPVALPRAGTDKEKSIAKEHSKHNVTYVSRRRPVTEEEKNRAFQMAKEEVTEGSFLVVMRPTHVYKSFFLTIPAEWNSKYLMNYEKGPVRLNIKDRTWLTRLVFTSMRRGIISSGWKEFSLDNCLEEFDVCVFKLTNQRHEPSVLNLDVSIFRVVPEAVKSIRVRPAYSRNRKLSLP